MSHQIILFDGVCNLCASSVKFIIRNDPNQYFQFASLQSEVGQKLLAKFDQRQTPKDSLVLIDGNNAYFKSSAALLIAKKLKGFWRVFYFLIVIPKPIRDFVYDIVAKNRYKIFGKKESCIISNDLSRDPFL